MQYTTPAFAYFHMDPLKEDVLPAVEAHNNRTMPVPNADAQKPDGVVRLLLKGTSLSDAVEQRIRQVGVKYPPNAKRAVAAEAIFSFSPDAPTPPAQEVFIERGMGFAAEKFGQENVVAAWFHDDEKSPHLHVIFVPICQGFAPGCPIGDEEQKKTTVVSWNQVSGSDKRVYRDPAKVKKKEPKRKHRRRNRPPVIKPKCRENLVMAGLQTDWAAMWADHGYRRGIKSSRRQLPMKWIHGQLAHIEGLAEDALTTIEEVIDSIHFSLLDELKLRQNPTAALPGILRKYLLPEIFSYLAPLKELAARGIQLDVEKKARVAIGDAFNELEKRHSITRESEQLGLKKIADLTVRNKTLLDELEQWKLAVSNPGFETIVDEASTMDDAEFSLVIEARKASRNPKPMHPLRPHFLRELKPESKPEPGPSLDMV